MPHWNRVSGHLLNLELGHMHLPFARREDLWRADSFSCCCCRLCSSPPHPLDLPAQLHDLPEAARLGWIFQLCVDMVELCVAEIRTTQVKYSQGSSKGPESCTKCCEEGRVSNLTNDCSHSPPNSGPWKPGRIMYPLKTCL